VAHGGVSIDELKEPIQHVRNRSLTTEQQRYELDMLQQMNRWSAERWKHDTELEARIQAFELAFRMQTEAPEAFDLSGETEATKRLYGLDEPLTRDFAWQCLMARRLAERNVRFIQINHEYGPGNEVGWDAHSELIRLHTKTARMVDQPIAALLTDLKARGLLKDTLVVWGGEFGRTPIAQAGDGRDHNPYGYTMWMAGGGVKGGTAYGATDDYGYFAVEDRMHIHDLHATVLHLLGLDHTKLTYLHAGRNFRLTDVAGQVAHKILA
jgi:arylsulfatase A-like enzyme